ncbi:transposase [Burkholderia sp. IT-111MI5]
MPSAALRQTVANYGLKLEADQAYAEGSRKRPIT